MNPDTAQVIVIVAIIAGLTISSIVRNICKARNGYFTTEAADRRAQAKTNRDA